MDTCRRNIVTKANNSSANEVSEILQNELKVTTPVFNFYFEAKFFCSLDGKDQHNIKHLAGKNLLIVSGIAQPDSFKKMLENHKGNIINHLEFADHHDYSNNDVQKILNKNAEIKPDYIITTEKDAVKLRRFSELMNSVWILEIEVHPEESWHPFFESYIDNL